MDNYIVRIFRRDARDPEKIAGLVEIVATDEQRTFCGCDELREILGLARAGKRRPTRKTARRKR